MNNTNKTEMTQHDLLKNLVSPEQIVELYPNLYSAKELKSLIKNRRYNGLHKAIHKIPGRKLVVSIPEFTDWVQSRFEN